MGLLLGLEVLDLSFNSLTGNIPTEIGLLTNLKIMGLRQNSLDGPIPTEIGLLTQLTSVGLDENQLTGSLPSHVALLTNLKTLNVGGTNSLTGGSLPFAELESTPFYVSWVESYLEMTGSLPTEIGLCTTLTSLELFVQDLQGRLPTELALLSDNLLALSLEFNSITGTIPTALGSLTKLTRLALHDNAMVGGIPTQVGNLAALTSLEVGRNQLTGSLPSELGRLAVLQIFNANDNPGLTGSIPEEMATMAVGTLRMMNVTHTGLSGSIPMNVCFMTFECREECYFDYECQPEGGLCGCGDCKCPIEVLSPNTNENTALSSSGASSTNMISIWPLVILLLWMAMYY